eukprot:2963209-Pleurochrysis_carterae.AAC.1
MVCERGAPFSWSSVGIQLLVKLHEFLHHGVPFGKRAIIGRFLRLEGVDLATSVLHASDVATNCRLALEVPVRRWSVLAMKTIQLADYRSLPPASLGMLSMM